jgi:signal transduction histidine kinase
MMDAADDRERLLDELRLLLGHEMKSPLMVLEGFTSQLLAQHGEQLGEKGARYLQRMLAAERRLSLQVEASLLLMDAARRPLDLDRVDLTARAGAVAADCEREFPGRRVGVQVEPGMFCEADPVLLTIALRVLVGNAFKFTAAHPQAEVRIGREPGVPAVFFVADNGVGFDPASAGKLFQAFTRLHPANQFDGLGLGLAIARHAIERHGGRIWGEGRAGEGAYFRFTVE